jgi:nucleotide-binding universal stress UspA family protein
MTTTTTDSTTTTERAAPTLFSRIVVGIDRSPESLEAARQAAVLAGPGGGLILVGAWAVPAPRAAVIGGQAASPELNAGFYRTRAEDAVAATADALDLPRAPTTEIVRGLPWEELIREARTKLADLVVVGSHGQGRMRGIVNGSTPTAVVHKAPCSVLVAREADDRFPRRVVVGVDGSPESAAAYEIARRIADRFGSELWPAVAHGGDGVDTLLVDCIVGPRRDDLPDEPVQALVAASADADLLVVGSRGLHGLKSLGSVSERVAHRARCSTLIVRWEQGS